MCARGWCERAPVVVGRLMCEHKMGRRETKQNTPALELSLCANDLDWYYDLDKLDRGYFSLVHARRVVCIDLLCNCFHLARCFSYSFHLGVYMRNIIIYA